MNENKVPTLSIVLDMPNKKPANNETLDEVMEKAPAVSSNNFYLISTDSGQKVAIKDFPFTIGRALTGDLVIMDKNVSRTHAELTTEQDQLIISNKGSLNGVRVNNRKVERAKLSTGDIVMLANAQYTVLVERAFDDDEVAEDDSLYPVSLTKKSASNDDLLDEDDFALADSAAASQTLNTGGSNNKLLYALVSVILIAVAATVITLMQSTPNLDVAVQRVTENITSGNESPSTEPRIANSSETEDKLQDQGVESATYTDVKTDVVDNSDSTLQQTEQFKAGDSTQNTSNDVGDNRRNYDRYAKYKQDYSDTAPAVTSDPQIQSTEPAQQSTDSSADQINQQHQDTFAQTTDTTGATASTPRATEEQQVAQNRIEPVRPQASSRPVVSKPSPYSRRTSQIKLDNARASFIGGNYQQSQHELRAIINNSRHQRIYRNQARSLMGQYGDLYALYEKGQSEYRRNNKPAAFKTWASYLKKERSMFPGGSSQYARNVKRTVAMEYEEKGRQAYMRDDWRGAFRYWERSLKMRPNASISSVMQQMENEIASLYTRGSQMERVNKQEAIKYWTEVVDKAPENHKYYLKAKAKLHWLQNSR